MTELTVKVLRKKQEAVDIASFELGRADGGHLPPFSAGSHVDVHTPGGFIRQYSLCSDADEKNRYRIAVLRDPATRGGSVAMHDKVAEGDLLTISEPRNHFPLVHAQRTILFAGGIGVTPLLCMAQRLATIGADFVMHYCARSIERAAFRDEIAASQFAHNVHFHFDDGDNAQKLELAAAIGTELTGTHIYVCGPTGFIDFVLEGAKSVGLPGEQIHSEYFGAATQDASDDSPFQVKIATSGRVLTVEAGQTVVRALEAAGIDVPTSCEQGVCGACLTRVLEGECEHRDLYLTAEEKSRHDQFTPCCSRAKSAMLVLDI